MNIRQIIDIEQLLCPIDEEAPAGVDLRGDYNSSYHQIKDNLEEARRQERNQEKWEQVPSEERKSIDYDPQRMRKCWKDVFWGTQDLLQKESKDLQVAAWLVESSLRLHLFNEDGACRERSFLALRDGLQLIRKLCETFWDEIYPCETGEGIGERLKPIFDLSGEDRDGILIKPIRKIPITAGEPPFSTVQYEFAHQIKGNENELKIDHFVHTYNNLEISARKTPEIFFWNLRSDLLACRSELANLTQWLHQKTDALYTSRLDTALETVEETLRKVCIGIAGKRLGPDEDNGGDGGDDNDNNGDEDFERDGSDNRVPSNPKMSKRAIENREDGFRQLLEIADFFEKNEPQSPIAYTLKEVVRRGRLSFLELLGELADESSRLQILERSGINPYSQSTEETE